jgi:hypothetical protein
MQNSHFVRSAGLWCIAGGIIAVVGATVTATIPSSVPSTDLSYLYTPTVFRFTQALWAISYMLMFVGTLGLTRSGAAGGSRLGRIGLGMALVGLVVIVLCNVGFAFFANATDEDTPVVILDSVIGMASMLTALGFVVTGIAVLRSGVGRDGNALPLYFAVCSCSSFSCR